MIIHLAGQDHLIRDRWQRQRCSWCGALLMDEDLVELAKLVAQSDGHTMIAFTVGAWVQMIELPGGGIEFRVLDVPDGEYPAGSCVSLSMMQRELQPQLLVS